MSPALRTLLRLRGPRPQDFTAPVHDTAVVAHVGRWLGIAIGICFVTGLLSHNAQDRFGTGLVPWPAWGYRFSQGLHVASGIAAVPLLLAKVLAAYPRLFVAPALPRPGAAGLPVILERGSIAVLVGAAFFEISTGLLNSNQWYVFGFNFVPVHYAVAWVMAGALLVHLAVKLPVIRAHLGRGPAPGPAPTSTVSAERRGFVRGTLAVTGLLTLLSVGQSVGPLSRLAVLAPRRPRQASRQGVPINKTAVGAGVAAAVTAPGWADDVWRLTLVGPSGQTTTLSRADLGTLTQHTVDLPVACVEGWSTSATWSGVRVRDLVALAGGDATHRLRFDSLEQGSPYSTMLMPPAFAAHPDTLLATMINGEVLDADHGFPARIMAPNRPGVLQTKWVVRMEVLLP